MISGDTSYTDRTPPKCNGSRVQFISNKGKQYCPCSYGQNEYQFNENAYLNEDNLNMKKEKKRPKKNKHKCECPEEQLEFHFDLEDWIDDAQRRKIKSTLTQTVSGFKFNVAHKTPEPEMSFEEILRYYAEACEQKYKKCGNERVKQPSKNNASVTCKCPPVEEQIESSDVTDEPFQGIKFHIGGKGSGSKGLTGILCFPLLE